MLISGVLYLLGGTILVLLSPFLLFADVTQSSSISSSIATISSYLSPFNMVLPIDTVVTILNVVLVVEAAYFTFKCVYWLIRRIPTQS